MKLLCASWSPNNFEIKVQVGNESPNLPPESLQQKKPPESVQTPCKTIFLCFCSFLRSVRLKCLTHGRQVFCIPWSFIPWYSLQLFDDVEAMESDVTKLDFNCWRQTRALVTCNKSWNYKLQAHVMGVNTERMYKTTKLKIHVCTTLLFQLKMTNISEINKNNNTHFLATNARTILMTCT